MKPGDFEISERRVSCALLDGDHMVRLPSNAEAGLRPLEALYQTWAFPDWSLCTEHGILYNLAAGGRCPNCPPAGARERARRQAVRFVRACPAGHMDDVDWPRTLNHLRPDCHPDHLLWQGGGAALQDIHIVCPRCGASSTMAEIYNRPWNCSGRLPELGTARPGCPEPSRVIQRGAANLRIPEVVATLTLPPRDSTLYRILASSAVRSVLAVVRPQTGADVRRMLGPLVEQKAIKPAQVAELKRYSDYDIARAVEQVLVDSQSSGDAADLLQEEFLMLQDAASHGAPAQPRSPKSPAPGFEVVRSEVRPDVRCIGGHGLRVAPVSRLMVIMVQRGYTRSIGSDASRVRRVSCGFDADNLTWYPAAELSGEGVFIDLAPRPDGRLPWHFPLTGPAATAWRSAWESGGRVERELHPVFVWWHTFAHRLITAMSLDSGYSSSALRERVYLSVRADGSASGGVLIYTVQPGGDGTLGGLVALVPNFDRVVNRALAGVDVCSNDPLCIETRFAPGRHSGPSCYACLLVSETSCEHRNMHLDRELLRDNLP